MVSRDYNQLNVFNIEYMVDNNSLGFLVSDNEENLIIYMYQPESRESFGGQKRKYILFWLIISHVLCHTDSIWLYKCLVRYVNGDDDDDD